MAKIVYFSHFKVNTKYPKSLESEGLGSSLTYCNFVFANTVL